MRLKDVIRGKKDSIKIGSWHHGKVPKADFPIARSPYRLGNSFRWCVITFRTLETECRVLVIQNEGKQKFEAILGVLGGNGTIRVLCSYEYHPDEPGWHCHATHEDANSLSQGAMRGPWFKRIPAARKVHRQDKYRSFRIGDDSAAIRFVCNRYKIEQKGTLL